MRKFVMLLALAFSVTALAMPVKLVSGDSSCVIDTKGARLVSYLAHGEETLWCPPKLEFNGAPWVHGGVPVCWPWFGGNAAHELHGISWRSEFELVEHAEKRAVLRLVCDGVELKCSFDLADKLSVKAEMLNLGTRDFPFAFGFHPYFRVGDCRQTQIEGVDDLLFLDDPSMVNGTNGVWHGQVKVTGQIDRIYQLKGMEAVYRILDNANRRTIKVSAEGANFVNIWNPERADTTPGNLAADQIRYFVAVEPIYCRDLEVRPMVLKAGARHTVKMTVEVVK